MELVNTEHCAEILVLDRSRELRDLLAADGYQVAWVDDPLSALAQGRVQRSDVTVLDIDLGPVEAGLALCDRLTGSWPDTPVVVVTERSGLESAVGAMRSGAYDFIRKPVSPTAVQRAVSRAIRHRTLRTRLQVLSAAVEQIRGLDGFVGSCAPMRSMYAKISKAAKAHTSVLITGESGTGKELVARAIHHRSSRRSARFVAVNCAAIPAPLLESELFGHVEGAFTDARTSRHGLFAQADGGTLLLDEIGEMPPEMQAKLLRVLQDRTVRPIGSELSRSFDVRVLAATNRDLEVDVARKLFREDLYYRINAVRVRVPPLRARGNDILRLAEHFLIETATRVGKEVHRISPQCARSLLRYDWPGNVRELQNAIERAVTLAIGPEIEVSDLPERVQQAPIAKMYWDDEEPSTMPSLRELRQSYINQVLSAVGGNRTRAAGILGLDRRTLYRHLKRAEQEHDS